MTFVLPSLNYAYDALEPYIDARTMEIHYTKHHQAYVDNLNIALASAPAYANKSLVDLLRTIDTLPDTIQTAVRNNGGGHYNHSLFWQIMKKNGGGMPVGNSATAINKKFGSFEQFKEQFNLAAKSIFGSGWAWLAIDTHGDLVLLKAANQDNPIMQQAIPFFGLDVWEHAYYLHYQNRRADYIAAWWNVVDWEQVEQLFNTI